MQEDPKTLSEKYPYTCPFDYMYAVRNSAFRISAVCPQSFLSDGASGDFHVFGKKVNAVRDLCPQYFTVHDLRYLLGGDIILPPGAKSWREGTLVPVPKKEADKDYALGLLRRHHYKEALVRYIILRSPFSQKAWDRHREQDLPDWREKLENRLLRNPFDWCYDMESWFTKELTLRSTEQ